MGRKLVSEMNPEELKVHREYMQKKKAESRAKSTEPEKDNRGYRNRAEYMREYRKNPKENKH